MLAGETWGTTGPRRDTEEQLGGRADQLNTVREGKEGAEMRQHPVHRSSASFCKRSPEAGRHSCSAIGKEKVRGRCNLCTGQGRVSASVLADAEEKSLRCWLEKRGGQHALAGIQKNSLEKSRSAQYGEGREGGCRDEAASCAPVLSVVLQEIA